ncbi:MAG: hypothetical protein HY670_04120 [Chloroflexi bacterium]|nr:hypothetical protein [Chloroflexota bacterium]
MTDTNGTNKRSDSIRTKWDWPVTRDWGVPFTKNWLNYLVSGIDQMEDRELARSIISRPGAACAANFLDHMAKDHGLPENAELDDLIRAVDDHIRNSRFAPGCERQEDGIHVVYPPLGLGKLDCGCPLVFNEVVELTPTQCFCSARMHQLIFEHVTGKPVQVEILESLGQGGKKCAFRVQVPE